MFYNTAIYFQCFITGPNFIWIERIGRSKGIFYRNINTLTDVMPFINMNRIAIRISFSTNIGVARFRTYNYIHAFTIN